MRKVVVSGMIGNGLEWYDYALYGQMALVISRLFFPHGDPAVQLLATYGIFAAGFIVRPLGAVLFGWIGDTYGRKRAMVLAVLMMAIPTGCIGLLPTYAEIGILAPIALVIIRLLQGLSLGGEFSGSITYIVEHAPQHKRGLAGAASLVSLILGFLLGSLVGGLTANIVGQEAFEAWGWRIPFLLGVVIGLVGFYIRHHCDESPTYEKAKSEGVLSKTPVRDALKSHPKAMFQGFAMYLTVTMPFYLTTVYFIGFSNQQLGLTMAQALNLNIINMLVLLAAMPFSAWLSDSVGRKRIMMIAAAVMLLSVYPLFSLFAGADIVTVALVQATFALMLGMYIGPVAAVLVELFPTSVRFTGMALAYNMSAAIFGGTAPMVCTWLISTTGNPTSIAFYVMACNVASLVALLTYHDHWREPLR